MMEPSLKIAVFHDLIPGGSKRCVQEFVKVLSKRHTIDLYRLTSNNKNFFDLTPFIRDVHTFEYKRLFFRRPFGSLSIPLDLVNQYYILEKIYYKIATAIDKGSYDLVFIHAALRCRYHVPGLLRYLSTPSVYYCQEPHRIHYESFSDLDGVVILPLTLKIQGIIFSPSIKLYMYLLKRNDSYRIKNADLVLCNSRYSKEYIYKVYNILPKVNYLGVDARKFMPLDIPKENLILSVGYLEKRKGHDFVILAIANIPREIRPRLGIVYLSSSEDDVRAREYKKYLERLADDNRVEVSFFPDVSDDELVLLYNKAKLTTCAFIREPFGFIPLESMACQVPVVAINEGGLRESIIHNQTGILTKRDMVEFVKAMEYLLKNEETRIRMGKSGRQHVLNNWSWERATEELENNFLSLLRTQ